MSVQFKVTSLKVSKPCKAEQFDLLEREAKAKHNDEVNDDMFDYLYSRISYVS